MTGTNRRLLFKAAAAYRFQYGIFVADSKLVTHDLICSMNDPQNHVPFISRCPASFDEKLENPMIQKAYSISEWEEFGTFHGGKAASFYCCQSFIEEVCGQSMCLQVLESSSLKEKASQAIDKAQ